MKYYRVCAGDGSGKILGWCKESTMLKVEHLLKGKKFSFREIPESQYNQETKEIQFVF